MADELILLDFWPSAYGIRVRIALAEKGIKYEYKEQDFYNKGSLLLEMNPVHKKIPVLIHNSKPICESSIIVQYVDEVWNDKSPVLPSDPYQRAQAMFWVDYIDKNIYADGKKIWAVKRENPEAATKEFIENMKTLEKELGEKPYFGGENFGFVDLVLISLFSLFYTYETLGNFSLEIECPKIFAWAKRCNQKESVSKSLHDEKKVLKVILEARKRFGVD